MRMQMPVVGGGGGGGGEAEFLPQRRSQPVDGLVDLFLAGRGEGRAQEHLGVCALLGAEPAALAAEHALIHSCHEDTVFELEGREGGMGGVVLGFDSDPVEHARVGDLPFAHLAG